MVSALNIQPPLQALVLGSALTPQENTQAARSFPTAIVPSAKEGFRAENQIRNANNTAIVEGLFTSVLTGNDGSDGLFNTSSTLFFTQLLNGALASAADGQTSPLALDISTLLERDDRDSSSATQPLTRAQQAFQEAQLLLSNSNENTPSDPVSLLV